MLAALKELGDDDLEGGGTVPTLGLQPAKKLIAEGIELAMKALMLARETTPPAQYRLRCLYGLVLNADWHVGQSAKLRTSFQTTVAGDVP